MTDPAVALAERWQRGFPLVIRPFEQVARESGLEETEVLQMLQRLVNSGALSRIGPAIRANTIGSSTLAAMRVPGERLDQVAEIVSANEAVNHNYERTHLFNLWFVVTGPERAFVCETLETLSAQTGCGYLDLRIETPYHIDLGFRLKGRKRAAPANKPHPGKLDLSPDQRRLVGLLEGGIALRQRPYAHLARQLGWTEADVLIGIQQLVDIGAISRFGCILRHHNLGYRANAMVVWDVPDDAVDGHASRLCSEDAVTLCYRRTRRPPDWPYNLFAMVHGMREENVHRELARIAGNAGLDRHMSSVLFSLRCFKQTGARYFSLTEGRA
jgi:DNA-binding Lrp family transcriptional regulator